MIRDQTSMVSLDGLNHLGRYNYRHVRTAFYQAAIESRLPVALWRQPYSLEEQALVDFSGAASSGKIDFRQKLPGFAFAPFLNEHGENTLFIKAGLHLNQKGFHFFDQHEAFDSSLKRIHQSRPAADAPPGVGGNTYPYPPRTPAEYTHGLGGPYTDAGDIWRRSAANDRRSNFRDRFLDAYQRLAYGSTPSGSRWVSRETNPEKDVVCTEAEFCALVEEAIDYINTTGVRKVVVSRVAERLLPPSFTPLTAFESLCQRYPQAFISLVSIPTVGTWIGASPEVLLSIKNDTIRTVALAGTQAGHPETPLSEVTWGAKEIEEQALVSDDIRAFFQRQDLSRYREIGPDTVSAGNVVHLQTKFEINLGEPRRSQLANQILYQLHPTSAVCGLPKEEAYSFILTKEHYDRAFYSGFLGPVHLNQQSHLYVNLRCMQLKRNSALLYVGAGITQDSNPQAEWLETVLKSKTLLDALQLET